MLKKEKKVKKYIFKAFFFSFSLLQCCEFKSVHSILVFNFNVRSNCSPYSASLQADLLVPTSTSMVVYIFGLTYKFFLLLLRLPRLSTFYSGSLFSFIVN